MPILKNLRHEAFARSLAEGKSAVDAYEASGFDRDKGNASRLRSNPKVQARLVELQQEIAAAVPVTIESLIAELEAARNAATGKNQFAAAIKAILGKAQLSGLLVERQKVEVSGGAHSFDDAETVEELTAAMVKAFFEGVEYAHSHTEEDIEFLYKVYADAYRTMDEATNKLKEEILARPRGSVVYRSQALPSPYNGKDSQHAVTDGK